MTLNFKNSFINSYYTLLGKNEHEYSIDADEIINDYYVNTKSVEEAESKYQEKSIKGLIKKSNEKIDLLIGGDLQSQLLASNYAANKFKIPFLGLYSACSTLTEGLLIASLINDNYSIGNICVTTSAHSLVSEKQFRFPIEYGSIKKKINTFTSTGSVSILVSNKESNIKIENATIGSVVDVGFMDANNFGAIMAPGVAKTIKDHLKDTNRSIDYYDLVLTGDLGVYGVDILKEYLLKEYKIKAENIKDAGSLLFEDSACSIAGGSGPTCLGFVFFNKILKSNYKKVLLVGSGSLHSKESSNVGLGFPSISHIVSLVIK